MDALICMSDECMYSQRGVCMWQEEYPKCALRLMDGKIPVTFIRKWFKDHYRTDACALVDDWIKGEKQDD